MSWHEIAFGDFAKVQPQVKLEKGTAYSFIEMSDVEPHTKNVVPKSTRIWKGSGGAKFENGDVIFARITSCLEHGKAAKVDNLTDSRGFGSTEFFVFRGQEGISDPDYIYYLACSPVIREPAIKSMIGASGRQRAQKVVLENTIIQAPEIQEQRRIAIVCAMWLTGFDVPSLSTLYLDKSLKAHTLMQAIARANRVNEGKNNGLIVDYCGILKHLRKALATFAGTQAGGQDAEIDPARPEEELLADLAESIALVKAFLDKRNASLDNVIQKTRFERNAAIVACKDAVNENDETRKRFEVIVAEYNREKDRVTIEQTFEALLTLVQELDEEDRRAVREGLDEESLAIFDLLKMQNLSASDIKRIKAVAVGLLEELKAEKLQVDQWRDKEATRDAVRVTIHDFLWSDKTGLPVESYTEADVKTISNEVFRHVYRVYPTVPSPCYAEAA